MKKKIKKSYLNDKKCLLFLLNSDLDLLDGVFSEPAFLSSLNEEILRPRKKVNKRRPNIIKTQSHEKIARDVQYKSWRGSKGEPSNYKGARVMKAQTKELHKQSHFNHMSSLMGKVRPPDRLPSPKPLKR
jgi:hypothetical protein